MLCVFYIVTLSLVCIVANGNECKPLEDENLSGVTEEAIQQLLEDTQNVTEHKDAYIAQLRETLKNDDLPPDIVKYYLFTSEKPKEPYNLTSNKGSFQGIPYDNKKPLAFGIHGFTKPIDLIGGSMGDLVQATLNLNKYNVIFVDYSELFNAALSVVVPKAYLAAKDMARFLQFLMGETGTKLGDIHVIGISLGGHMSGIIGQYLPGLGRITGLDAGGVFFYVLPKDLRLDRSDAIFVDVIHTGDASPFPKGLGFYPPYGHLDFYPNGGKFQPGCGSTMPIEQTPTTLKEKKARICMHNRMLLYYTESMCYKCSFVGTMCESYEKFVEGSCTPLNSKIAVMGEFATKPVIDLPENAMFFLNTNGHYPFCKQELSERISAVRYYLNLLLATLTTLFLEGILYLKEHFII